MAITPLYTLDEINAEITTWKAAFTALSAGKNYTISTGSSSQSFTANDIEIVWNQLQRFQAIRAQLEGGTAGSTQMLIGRPLR